jgi:hypothetical protein
LGEIENIHLWETYSAALASAGAELKLLAVSKKAASQSPGKLLPANGIAEPAEPAPLGRRPHAKPKKEEGRDKDAQGHCPNNYVLN